MNYLEEISASLQQEKFDSVLEEVKALKNDNFQIQRFPNSMMNFGFFSIDLTLFKNELLKNSKLLMTLLSEMIIKKFEQILEDSENLF